MASPHPRAAVFTVTHDLTSNPNVLTGPRARLTRYRLRGALVFVSQAQNTPIGGAQMMSSVTAVRTLTAGQRWTDNTAAIT